MVSSGAVRSIRAVGERERSSTDDAIASYNTLVVTDNSSQLTFKPDHFLLAKGRKWG